MGVNFNGTVGIRNIAWSRDNGDALEGTFTERALGTYTLQITTASAPDAATPETGDPATDWASIGTIQYRRAVPGDFTPHLRHRFDAAGALTYTPLPGASGSANVSVYVTDDGGTGVCGDDTSELGVFVIVIRALNDCPEASPASITVTQDSQVVFQLAGVDPDGDALQFEVTQPPAHGIVAVQLNSGAGGYAPNSGYCGPDSFKYLVTDGQCRSEEVTVFVTVQCRNRCPTAVAQAGPECGLEPGVTTTVILSANNSNAVVVLDGTLSSDPDGDPLTYVWLVDVGGVQTPVASGALATATLPLGLHNVILVVDDGRCVGTALVTVEVISVCQAVELLIFKVNDAILERRNKQPLIASLKAACASFERGSCVSGINQLRAFTNKVRAQIARDNPAEAAEFIRLAEKIAGCVDCPEDDGEGR